MWYIITAVLYLVPYYVLPSPVDVLVAAYEILIDGVYLNAIDTLIKVFLGIGLASLVAIPLGIVLDGQKP